MIDGECQGVNLAVRHRFEMFALTMTNYGFFCDWLSIGFQGTPSVSDEARSMRGRRYYKSVIQSAVITRANGALIQPAITSEA